MSSGNRVASRSSGHIRKVELMCNPPCGREAVVFAPNAFAQLFEIASVPEPDRGRFQTLVELYVIWYYWDVHEQKSKSTRNKLLNQLAKAKKHAKALNELLAWPPLQTSIRGYDLHLVLHTYEQARPSSADLARAHEIQASQRPATNAEVDFCNETLARAKELDDALCSEFDRAQAQLDRDTPIVSGLANRLDDAYRLKNTEPGGQHEVTKDLNAANLPLQRLTAHIVSLWRQTLGRPKISLSEGSRFMNFAMALYALVGVSSCSHSTLRDRLHPIAKLRDQGTQKRSNHKKRLKK